MKLKKWGLGLLVTVGILFLAFKFIAWPYLKGETKKISPQKVATYTQDGLDVTVNYSSPYKKDRVIFGELVPYGMVWRTGANEPTTFTTKTDLKIIDKNLAAGTYSLWTIPDKESWKIIFNTEVPEWGVTLMSGGKETTRNPETDVIQVEVPVRSLPSEQESFLIFFDKEQPTALSLSWDKVLIQVPVNKL